MGGRQGEVWPGALLGDPNGPIWRWREAGAQDAREKVAERWFAAQGGGGIRGGDRSAGGGGVGWGGACSQLPPRATLRGCGNSDLSSRTAVGGHGGAAPLENFR